MNSIKQIVLFYSKFSPQCQPIFQFLQQYNLPIIKVSVDSKNVRQMLKNGAFFKITGVPSMIVEKKDSVAELFQGPKVLQLLSQMVQSVNMNGGGTIGGGNTYQPQHDDIPQPSQQQPPQSQQQPYQPNEEPVDEPFSEPQDFENPDYDVLDDLLGGDIEELGGAPQYAPPPPLPLQRNGIKEQKTAELKNIAKQMEMERKRVLGIRD